MNIEINEEITKKDRYPWLGELNDDDGYSLVLFTDQDRGVVLSSTYHHKVRILDNFHESKFTRFEGSIRLSN